MKCRSKNNVPYSSCDTQSAVRNASKKAFSLIEVMTALTILAMVTSSVLVVMDRCMTSAADSTLRMQAFRLARENMEKLLASSSVKEIVEYGSSDEYSQIQGRTTVEVFYEPITERMWIQAICSAEYTDTEGDTQTVELTHWVTGLSAKEMVEIVKEKQREKERLAEQQQDELEEEPEEKPEDEPEEKPEDESEEKLEEKPEDESEEKPERTYCGYTLEEIKDFDFSEIWEFIDNCPEFREAFR